MAWPLEFLAAVVGALLLVVVRRQPRLFVVRSPPPPEPLPGSGRPKKKPRSSLRGGRGWRGIGCAMDCNTKPPGTAANGPGLVGSLRQQGGPAQAVTSPLRPIGEVLRGLAASESLEAQEASEGRLRERLESDRQWRRKHPPGLSIAHIGRDRRFQGHEGGSLLMLKSGGGEAVGGGRRGRCRGFSRGSRMRLIRFLASINEPKVEEARYFVTLTYPGEFSHDARTWKRDLKVFIQALREGPVPCSVVWKLEPQRRWAPHFHLLVFTVPHRVQILRQWVAQRWWQVVGEGSPEHLAAGTSVEEIKSWSGVQHYSAKYIAKIDRAEDLPDFWEHVGRWWGRAGEFPIDPVEAPLTDRQFFAMRRLLRRWRSYQLGRRVPTWGGSGLAVFLNDWDQRRLLHFFVDNF